MQQLTRYEAVALHEAAHGVVSCTLGLPIATVCIDPGGRSGRVTTALEGIDMSAPGMIPRGIAALDAGSTAERLAGLDPGPPSSDAEKIERLAVLSFERRLPQDLSDQRSVARAQAEALLGLARGRALAELVLRLRWGEVQTLAAALKRCMVLQAHHVSVFLEGARFSPLLCSADHLLKLVRAVGNDGFLADPRLGEMMSLCARADYDAEMGRLLRELEEWQSPAAERKRTAAAALDAEYAKLARLITTYVAPDTPAATAARRKPAGNWYPPERRPRNRLPRSSLSGVHGGRIEGVGA